MAHQAKDYLGSNQQENDTANSNRDKNTTDSTTGKPTSIWQSPEFAEFDLCMEVTAYVHQWK